MYLSPEDLKAVFNPTYLQRGRDYYQRGMVISTQSHHEGKQITASIQGAGRNKYQAHIFINFDEGQGVDRGVDIQGSCSCPVYYNCKHVAAALLHYIDHQAPQQSDFFGSASNGWLAKLKSAQPDTVRSEICNERILYLLNMNRYVTGNQLYVATVKARRRKDRSYSTAIHYAAKASSQAKLMRDDDPKTLSLLQSLKTGTAHTDPPLVGKSGAAALQLLIDTGRCHWLSENSPPLLHADVLKSTLSWQFKEDTTQVICADAADPSFILLPVIPPQYLNPATGECGVLDCGLPEKLASVLMAAPPVPVDEVKQLRKALVDGFKQETMPLPQQPKIYNIADVPPIPCLKLLNEVSGYYFDEPSCIAELHFEYDGMPIHPYAEPTSLMRKTGNAFEVIQRNPVQEDAVLDYVDQMGFIFDEFSSTADALQLDPAHSSNTWFDFMLHHRKELEGLGWTIEVAEDFNYQLDQADNWYANIDESSTDWFKLELGVEIAGEPVNLLPFLVNYLSMFKGAQAMSDLRNTPDDQPLLLQQENGRFLHIPMIKVRHIIDTLAELYDPGALDSSGSLQLSAYQSTQLAELDNEHTNLTWQGGEKLRKFGQRLRDFNAIIEVKPPATLKTELRDYQKEGLSWLQFLRQYELGGILADDMGLGKTVQALAHLLVEKKSRRADRPSLVVAPTSLMVNWRREAQRFAPSLKVLVLQGTDRKQKFPLIKNHDLILTTYPLLSRDTEILTQTKWHIVILDEAQHIKNPKSKTAQTARQLNTRHRLCLTGTPMENHLGELWSQFHFLMPGMLGDERQFRKLFRTPIEKQQDSVRQKQLRKRVAPFILRRDKSTVATELPPKTEILSEVELEGPQRDLYETIRVSMQSKVQQAIDKKGIARSHIIILDALLKLRQVCCHPQLLKLPSAKKVKHSAKLNQLMEMVPEMVAEGRSILLFSQFTSMLAIIEDELKNRKIRFVKLTGQTRNREKPIDDFQSGKVPVFLISLKAGGVGLNLTAADTVIHYDPWWNPAVENQATDRAHRIGQDKSVFVYKMITVGTVEEKITAMQAKKQALADALFAEGSKGSALSKQDLQTLFEPLA